MLQAHERTSASLPQLVRDLSTEVSLLFQQETALAKAELSDVAGRIGRNLGSVAIAGGVVAAAGLALLAAVIYGVTALLDTFLSIRVAVWLAPLLVAVVLGAIGYALLQKALAGLRPAQLTPRNTVETMQENKQWLKTRHN
jgi:hypothetical protein